MGARSKDFTIAFLLTALDVLVCSGQRRRGLASLGRCPVGQVLSAPARWSRRVHPLRCLGLCVSAVTAKGDKRP